MDIGADNETRRGSEVTNRHILFRRIPAYGRDAAKTGERKAVTEMTRQLATCKRRRPRPPLRGLAP